MLKTLLLLVVTIGIFDAGSSNFTVMYFIKWLIMWHLLCSSEITYLLKAENCAKNIVQTNLINEDVLAHCGYMQLF